MEWYGTQGTLKHNDERLRGFYLVKAVSLSDAAQRLVAATKERGDSFDEGALQTSWQGIQRDIEHIEKGEEEYYFNLGRGIYFLEE